MYEENEMNIYLNSNPFCTDSGSHYEVMRYYCVRTKYMGWKEGRRRNVTKNCAGFYVEDIIYTHTQRLV